VALGRLHDTAAAAASDAAARRVDFGRARVHYAVAAFVEPTGLAAARLRELGPPEPFALTEEQAVHPSARGHLREALVALAPLVLGLPPATVDADPAPAWEDKLRSVVQRAAALGQGGTGERLDSFACAVVVDAAEPAWAEPTRPPRILLARRALADEAVARFAAARAAHALYAGVPLIEGRTPEDVAGLLRAATALFLPDLAERPGPLTSFIRAWQVELGALPLDPERLPEARRARLEGLLAAAAADSSLPAAAADYARAERLSADRIAYAATGDLRAGLVALAPAAASSSEARAAALATPALSELVAFALALTA
jgi:hypothetical protein